MNKSRRSFLRGSTLVGAGLLTGAKTSAQHEHHQAQPAEKKPAASATMKPASQATMRTTAGGPVPVYTPDLPKLPFEIDNGVKVFHLIAEPVKRELLPASSMGPAKVIDAWGYNGSTPGPTIEINEGDRVRI